MPKLTEYKKAIALVDSSSDKVLIKYKIKASEIGAGEHPVEITLGQMESRYTDSEIFKTDSQKFRRVSVSFANNFLSSRIVEDETPYSILVYSTPLIEDKFDAKLKLYKFNEQTKSFEFEKELENKFTVENVRDTTYQLRTKIRKNEVGEGISKIKLVLQPKNTAFEPMITQTGEFKFKFRSDLQVKIPDITLSKTGEEKEISCEIKDLFGAPEKAEIVVYVDNHEISRKEVSLSPYSYTHLEKIKLPTDQVKEYELKVVAVSKFDNKEYVAKKNYQVEEQSNLTINGQKSAYITPKNIALDIQNDIQIRNNNSFADRIRLEYISEDVEVTGPSELEIQGKSMTYLPISVKPKKDGNHQVKIVATSQNDTTKVYEVSFAVQTREILSNQFMLRLGQGSVSLYENEQLETFVEITNTGDTPISEIKLTATSENTVTAVLENESLNNIAPFETRRMKVTLSASSLSEEYQNNNVIITATGSENVSIRKSIHVQVMKKKGKLLINNGNAIQTVSGGQNEEVRAQIIVSNIGNADLSNLTIQSNDPNVVIEKNSVNVLKPSDSYVFDVKIKAEASAEIGEFQHNVEIKHNGITKGYVTIKHIVTTAQTGTLELVVFDVTGKPFKRGKVKLHHKKLSDVNYELNLQDQKENQVLSQEMKIGEYKLYLLNEKEEKIREMDITILPNLILQQPIQLDIKDKLFNTEFNISKEKTKDGYTINIISASPGAKLPEDVPSIDLGGEIYTLEPGQRRDVNLSVINNSVYNIQNVELEMALLNQIGQQSGTTVQVIIHDPGTINLGPKETKNIPVTIVATANAKIDDETTILVSAKAECTDFKITKAGGSLLFAKTAIGGVVRTTDDVNRPLPSYPNTGGGGIQQIIIDKPQIPNYSPYKKGQTQLNISSQITMDREILKANLRIFEVKEETKLKSVYVHILDKNREEITNKFFQKAYKGEEYTGENTIIPGKEYEIGWYLAENSFFVQEPTEFIAFAQIIYEENGQQQIENTQEVTFTLNPLPYLDVEFEMPNYMLANKEYEFKTTIHNVGKGTAKNFNMKTLGSALEKELGLVSLSSDELKNKDIAPNEKVTTVVKMKSTRETAIENRLLSWQYQNDLGLDIMPLIKGIRIKVNDEAKRVMQERIKKRNHPDPVSCINDPIDLSSGAQVVDMELLAMDGSLPLQYFISYNSHLRQATSHGNGWTNIFDMKVEKTAEGIDVHYNGVKKNSFVANGDGTYRTGDADRMDDILTEENGEYVITKKDNIRYRFYADGRLKQVAYKDDKTIDITYDGDNKTIKDTQSGVFITVSMQDGKVTELIDNGGRKVSLTYDDKGNLTQVQNPLGNIMKYEYDDQNRIVRGYDEEGELLFENVYDEMDRIIKQTDALSSEGTSISYEETEKELIAKVTDRLGHIKTYTHDKVTGRLQKLEDEEGLIFERIYDENSRLVEEKDAQASIRYEYDSNGNLTKITDKLGRVTSYTYDDQGNLLTQTTPRQNTTKMTYDDHGKLLSITNPIGDVLKNEYDPKGNLISTTLPNNDKLSYTVENGRVTNVKPKKDSQYTKVYDEFGRVSEIQNPVGGAIKFTYFGDNQIKTITDESGNITKFEYDKRGNLSQITDPLGHTQKYRYNLYKDLVSYTDQEGNQTLYNYDAERNLVMTTYPNKSQSTYRYDVRGNLIKETDALGNVTTYTYDSVGNLIQVQKADRIQTYIYDKAGQLVQSNTDKVTSYTYDEDGNLKTISDANGEKTVVSYDELGRIISVTDKEGHEENYTYDETGLKDYIGKDKQKISYEREYGQITKIIDQEGNEVRYEYDKMGRATKIIDQEGNEHQIDYTPTGQISSITDPYKHAVSYEYDAVGRKIAQIDKNGNKTSFVYSPSGNLIEIQNTLGNKVSFVYDSLGNVIRETDAAGNETIHQYNKAGELIESISPLGNHTLYEYNAFGEVVKVSDSIGTIRTLSYNNKGYLSSEQDADGNTTKYEYNPTGTLSKITEPNGKETLYGYDKEGRLIQTQSGKDKQKATQTYDEAGLIKQIIDPKERSIEFGYDTRGNLITQSEQMAQGTKTTKFTYNAKNLLQSIENAKGQKTNLLYDKLGRVIEQKEEKEKTTYRYDANGNILEVQNSQGVIKREYDALNRVSKVIDQNGEIIRYIYDEVGNLKTLHYPAKENSDAKAVHYTYDASGNILTVTDWNSRVTSYTYDVRGRETSEQRPNGSTKTITYDANNRILELLDVDAKGNILLRYEMAYDAQGNIIRRTSTDKIQIGKAQTQTYSYNYDQLTNQDGKNISYDAEGNPLSYHSQGKSYALKYDQRNRLIAVGENSYTYDAENARITKIEEGQTTHYSIDKENGLPRVLKERQGAKTTWYVYGNGLIGQETISNDIGTNIINRQIQSANPKQSIGKAYRSYHYDQQGNTILLTDEQGEVKVRYSYDPYGQVLAHQGEDTVYQYSGKYGIQTDKTKLLYMRARYYDPNSKRFLGQDILMGNLSDIRSLNRYAYVEGNPMKYIDPTGMFAEMAAHEHTGYGKWKKPKPTKKNEQKKSSVPSKPSKVRDEKTAQQMLRDMTEEQLWEIARNCQDPRQGNAAQALYLKYSAEAKKAELEAKIWGGATQGLFVVKDGMCIVPGVGVFTTSAEGIYTAVSGDTVYMNGMSDEEYWQNWKERQGISISSSLVFASFLAATNLDVPLGDSEASTPNAPPPSTPTPSFTTGAEAEEYLAKEIIKSDNVLETQKRMTTSMGPRIIDVVDTDNIAHESKMGYQEFSSRIEKQILKDLELLENDDVKGVVWHFFRSANTKKIGGSKRLFEFLEQHGIPYIIHD